MPSTFFGLTIAGSALNSFQAAVNTTANNIANVNTKGYTRQEAVRIASEALRTNQRYGMAGSGVTTTEIIQKREFYYDVKYWENNARVGMQDCKLYYMQQMEEYLLDDDNAKGFATILGNMFNALETLHGTPEDLDARNQFVSETQKFADFFRSMNVGLVRLQEDANQEIATQVESVNAIAQKIALLNKQINVIELQGTNANELRDQRALLIDELSDLAEVEVKETPVIDPAHPNVITGATNYKVKINGQTLVDNFEYNTLKYVAREKKVNQTDAEGLYDICWSDTNVPFNVSSKNCQGRIAALFQMRDGNNNQGFNGTVESIVPGNGGDIVTINNPSITDINCMNMADDGIITINNKEYRYSGFSYDADTQTYQFQLKIPLTTDERENLTGRKAAIGESIDVMGVPYYQSQANMFLREFAKQLNNIQKSGVDLNGNEGGSLLVAENASNGSEYGFADYDPEGSMSTSSDSYYKLTAANVKVAGEVYKNPDRLVTMNKKDVADGEAVQNIVEQMQKLKSDIKMFRGGGADQFLKCLINDNSVDTQKAETFLKNYSNISESILQKRMSISAVDEDEEALDMLRFQHAYNLASRMVQTMSEMYNRLILETGV
ncbi:flagellar hook-associated protein FlgK [Lachnospiraceae bacterium]|nr:flagellar hook-associated protein FlgK [Lachnospiraceae bacterium]